MSKKSSSSSGSIKFLNLMEEENKFTDRLQHKDLFDELLEQPSALSAQANSEILRTIEQLNLSPRQQQGCKCSKIDCLKLYCQCFAKGKICSEVCLCVCCKNTAQNIQQIYKAKQIANFRHPGQFQGVPSFVPTRKCTCKKSLCRKKYCQCFNAGLKCTEQCQCINCHNGKPDHDHLPSMMEIQVHA